MTMTPQDMFECEYMQRTMKDIECESAKKFMEERRYGVTYNDPEIAKAFRSWIQGLEW